MTKSKFLLKRRFSRLGREFQEVYKDISGGAIDEFLMPFWDHQNNELVKFFSPSPPFNFLDHPNIRNTMFVSEAQGWVPIELPLVNKTFRTNLPLLAQEDPVGSPEILPKSYDSSPNLIHHLYHFAKYQQSTGHKISQIKTVVEWGGGYGNMAKLFRRLNPESTYTIIDTALFSALQWLYLSTLLPREDVNVIRKSSDKIKSGKINLLPLKYLKSHVPKAELFISTWGLSESTKAAQDYVINRSWFGAGKILIGFQESTSDLSHASRLGKLAKSSGAKIEETAFIKNNFYAFR